MTEDVSEGGDEKDMGPNTGGMGAYSPAPVVTKTLEKKIIDKIIKPTLKALKSKNKPKRKQRLM